MVNFGWIPVALLIVMLVSWTLFVYWPLPSERNDRKRDTDGEQ